MIAFFGPQCSNDLVGRSRQLTDDENNNDDNHDESNVRLVVTTTAGSASSPCHRQSTVIPGSPRPITHELQRTQCSTQLSRASQLYHQADVERDESGQRDQERHQTVGNILVEDVIDTIGRQTDVEFYQA